MTSNPAIAWGLALKHYREMDRDITQRELADELGVDFISVSRWERGASVPRNVRLRAELEKRVGQPVPRLVRATAEPAVPPEGASPSDTEIADQLARRRPGGRARRSTGSGRPRRPRPPQSEGE